VGGFVAGGLGELNQAFARLAGITYRNAWRLGPSSPLVDRMTETLKKATADIQEITRTGEGR
jgi:hypothetical protein